MGKLELQINLLKFINWRMWSKDKSRGLKKNWKGWRGKKLPKFSWKSGCWVQQRSYIQ